ncbi:DUF1836 domain-containing protein [Christensenellaceae bacterium OttesenSCG-928-L17]|nr:DUF1836 domain-containing protein [Christensenellaceae bacterium OttesenSCG-928-L17]
MRIDAAQGYRCPRYAELPAIPLYMDQVMLVLEEALQPFAEGEERVVTPTMINNYVKQKFIDPPEKKKYMRDHLAALIVVSILKKVLSMQEINGIISMMLGELGIQKAYDMFCERLEQALLETFVNRNAPVSVSTPGAPYEQALNAAVLALMGKLLVQSLLAEENA